jgi:hypothetical protein
MARLDRELVAAPPDDGHLGNFTTPGDVVAVRDDAGRGTPTNQDPSRSGTIDRAPPRRGMGPGVGTIVIAIVVMLAVLLVGWLSA